MSIKFWILRFSLVLVAATAAIFIAQYLKSGNQEYALTQSIIWGPLTALVYISVLLFKLKRNPACAIKQQKQ